MTLPARETSNPPPLLSKFGFGVLGLGFWFGVCKVWGLGVWVLGFGILGFGCGVYRFGVYGLGFGVQGLVLNVFG